MAYIFEFDILFEEEIWGNFPRSTIKKMQIELDRVARRREIKAKKKIQEIIMIDGHRYALNCHYYPDLKLIEVSKVDKLKRKKKRPWN